jgi:hypothetical protein
MPIAIGAFLDISVMIFGANYVVEIFQGKSKYWSGSQWIEAIFVIIIALVFIYIGIVFLSLL